MPPAVTPRCAVAATALFITLSLRVIALRRSDHLCLGEAGNPALLARIRAPGNGAEQRRWRPSCCWPGWPAGTSAALRHLSDPQLLAGRAWALSGPGRFGAHSAGMQMTFAALRLSAALAPPWPAIF